jgi:hypothetical protein
MRTGPGLHPFRRRTHFCFYVRAVIPTSTWLATNGHALDCRHSWDSPGCMPVRRATVKYCWSKTETEPQQLRKQCKFEHGNAIFVSGINRHREAIDPAVSEPLCESVRLS